MRLNIKKQKGFSLFITVVFMSIMLSIVIGLNTILFGQLKSLSQAGNSVVAFYAADAGSEFILTTIVNGTNPPPKSYALTTPLESGALYEIETRCCSQAGNPLCIYDGTTNTCPILPVGDPAVIDNGCQGRMYCSRVIGTYNNTKRTIEIDI
jgi:hypothetical protein